ncbi:hypothetical protein IT409_01510 [Candidatus Falkowbacteria bacterium]|nr:hypothetical protein [Candidatus Falkowbacteria bacterium]
MEQVKQNKIVIIGGVHGDDLLGLEVLKFYFKKIPANFQLLIGNYHALEEKKKFIDFDLMNAGVGDKTCTTSIEKCRAGELHEVIGMYQHLISLHGSYVLDNVAIALNDDQETINLATALGAQQVIVIAAENNLLSTVPHALLFFKKVEFKTSPTTAEVADTVMHLSRLVDYGNYAIENMKKPEVIYSKATLDEIMEKGISEQKP